MHFSSVCSWVLGHWLCKQPLLWDKESAEAGWVQLKGVQRRGGPCCKHRREGGCKVRCWGAEHMEAVLGARARRGRNARCKRKGEKGVLLLEGSSRVLQHGTVPCSTGLETLQTLSMHGSGDCRALGERSSCSQRGTGQWGMKSCFQQGQSWWALAAILGQQAAVTPSMLAGALRPGQQRSLSHQEI